VRQLRERCASHPLDADSGSSISGGGAISSDSGVSESEIDETGDASPYAGASRTTRTGDHTRTPDAASIATKQA